MSMQEQTTAEQLSRDFDRTVSCWARALDFRDHEPEGHTEHVTEQTVRLALALGVSMADLADVRRGALLHDLGKMVIPDSIILKSTSLNDEEWMIMRQHPTFAYNLLESVDTLRPALDIPYCHHEKWDGSGYPRGLRGEEIPLAARIFAVVDVHDALLSRRPFRDPWQVAVVDAFIESLAGTHFDPRVVEVFLKLRW